MVCYIIRQGTKAHQLVANSKQRNSYSRLITQAYATEYLYFQILTTKCSYQAY